MNPEATGWFCWEGDTLLLNLRLQPKSSKDEFTGPYGDNSYKLKITAPPVEGKANKHLCHFLAGAFGVPISRVKLLKGENSRTKRISISKPVNFPLPLNRTNS